MRDEPDPPRKIFRLKPREFESVNEPGNPAPLDSSPTDVQGHFQAANTRPPPRLSQPVAAAPANDIQVLLRDQATRAHALGLNELKPLPRRRSRRKRDYWLVLIPVDGFFAFVALGPYFSTSMRVYAFSGFVMFTLGLTWVMWFVMDDY